jgi:hypothetical protein
VINNMQKFAKGEMLVVIGGSSRKSYVRTFQREEILNVDRVSVDMGNPLAQTLAGRNEMVTRWSDKGQITPIQEYEFLKTGQIDSIMEDAFRDAMLVREEDQELKEGRPPIALITDDHPYHIKEHRELLSDPDTRQDPQLVQLVLDHIQEHINLMKSMDPDLAAVLGVPPLPSQQMAPPMDPGMMGPPPEQQPPGQVPGDPNLPNVPPGTPPQVAEDYALATNQTPQEVIPQ